MRGLIQWVRLLALDGTKVVLVKMWLMDPIIDNEKEQLKEEKAKTLKMRDFKWIESRLDLEKMEASLHP